MKMFTNKIMRRCAWYGLLFMLWFAIFGMVLELGALALQSYRERTNPLIIAARHGAPLPVTQRPIALADAEGFYPPQIGGWQHVPDVAGMDACLQHVLTWGPRNESLSTEEHRSRQIAFAGLTVNAREAYALLHGEVILAFDERGRIREVYGADKTLFSGIQGRVARYIMRWNGEWRNVLSALDSANHRHAPHEFNTAFPVMDRAVLPLTCVCVPSCMVCRRAEEEHDRHTYVFCEMHPEKNTHFLSRWVTESARWDVPLYRSRKNMVGDFQTNSFGFRSKEVSLPKPANTFRIVCVGGSTTEEGETNNTTYPALLEHLLRQRFPDRNIEVINAGTSGISSAWHLLRLPEYLQQEPDLVVIHVGVNDLWRQYNYKWVLNVLPKASRFFRFAMPYLAPSQQMAFDVAGNETITRCLEIMTILLQQRGVAVAYASMAGPHPDDITRAEMQYYHYTAHANWKIPAFSLHGYFSAINASNQMLLGLSRRHNAFYIPVAERIVGGANVFWDFCHMTQPAIAAKAEVMFEFLTKVLDDYFDSMPVVPSEQFQ